MSGDKLIKSSQFEARSSKTRCISKGRKENYCTMGFAHARDSFFAGVSFRGQRNST